MPRNPAKDAQTGCEAPQEAAWRGKMFGQEADIRGFA
jgi:hypothetical protein